MDRIRRIKRNNGNEITPDFAFEGDLVSAINGGSYNAGMLVALL
jgi:hypothetical protein